LTEGIIQMVFNRYLSKLGDIPWDKKDLNELQQELIDEIKKQQCSICQEITETYENNGEHSITIKTLIGKR